MSLNFCEDAPAEQSKQDRTPGSLPHLQLQPIDDGTAGSIYRADQAIYPSSLTLDRLLSWIRACGQHFSHRFMIDINDIPEQSRKGWPAGTENVLAGTIIALPLRRHHWEDLLGGRLLEPDIQEQHLVHSSTPLMEVGIHVFHIEREEILPGRGFTKLALATLKQTADAGGWKVVGYSALVATLAGKGSFMKLGFEPTGYSEGITKKQVGSDQDSTRQSTQPLPEPLIPVLPAAEWKVEMLQLDANQANF